MCEGRIAKVGHEHGGFAPEHQRAAPHEERVGARLEVRVIAVVSRNDGEADVAREAVRARVPEPGRRREVQRDDGQRSLPRESPEVGRLRVCACGVVSVS